MGGASEDVSGGPDETVDPGIGEALRALKEPAPSPGFEARALERMRERMARGPGGGGAAPPPAALPRARHRSPLVGAAGIVFGLAAALLLTAVLHRLAVDPGAGERGGTVAGSGVAQARLQQVDAAARKEQSEDPGAGAARARAAAPLDDARLLAEHDRALSTRAQETAALPPPPVMVPSGFTLASARVLEAERATQYTWVTPEGPREVSLFYCDRDAAPAAAAATVTALPLRIGWSSIEGLKALRFDVDGARCALLARDVPEEEMRTLAISARLALERAPRARLHGAALEAVEAAKEAAAEGALSR